jgi:hypothetical protein
MGYCAGIRERGNQIADEIVGGSEKRAEKKLGSLVLTISQGGEGGGFVAWITCWNWRSSRYLLSPREFKRERPTAKAKVSADHTLTFELVRTVDLASARGSHRDVGNGRHVVSFNCRACR